MQDALLIKHHGRIAVLRPADIQWISAEGDYVEINSSGRKYLLRDRISRLEREFAPGEFLRIHRSLLVNRMNIKELQDRPFGECDVILDDGTKLSMARSRKTSVLRLLQGRPPATDFGFPMLHTVVLVIALLALQFSVGFAQRNPVDMLLETESAFAAMSASTSADSAFIAYIAPDAILLRPDPVSGTAWLRDHRAPTLMLRWKPAYGVASAAGDLGFTSGPFEDWDSGDTTGRRYHGEFMTAWRRQPDGVWKFVFDFGISHPEDTWGKPLNARLIGLPVDRPAVPDTNGAREALLRSDRDFTGGLPADVQLLRPDSLRILGAERALLQLNSERRTIHRFPLFADVASSGDLAYTYGRYTEATGGSEVKRGYYFTVWARPTGTAWTVLWDLLGRAR